MRFTNTRGTEIQCNVDRDFVFTSVFTSNAGDELTYNIKAGEDGVIFLNKERLISATDDSGWLIQIDDVYMPDPEHIIIVSSDGVIAMYKKENTNSKQELDLQKNNLKYIYTILLENEDCYYSINKCEIQNKEIQNTKADQGRPLLCLEIETEFNYTCNFTFEI